MTSAIEFHGLVKHYGEVRALQGIDLAVEPGEVFGFLGPNGAGKTTAIRILLDLIRPTAGSASVLGFDAQREPVEVHRRLGYLPSDAQFYDRMTVDAYLGLVERLRGQPADRAYADALIERFDLDRSRRIGELSRGNRQKVGIVQAFMSRPPVVVLDEPTSGLDPLMQDRVEALVRETAAEGRTVFFSSHVLSEVEAVCDRVAMLRRGEIVDVIGLAEAQRLASRRLEVRLAEPPAPGFFDGLPGVAVLAADGATVTFETRHGIDPLVKRLAQCTVLELDSHEPTLDDLFMRYYERSEPGAAREGAREAQEASR